MIRAWGGFDESWYRALCEDIGDDPVRHYLVEGEKAGLSPSPLFDPAWVLRQSEGTDRDSILINYLTVGWLKGVDPHPLFDSTFYRTLYGDIVGSQEPLSFYLREGWRRRHDPNPAFDTDWYIAKHGIGCGIDPLSHYVRAGATSQLAPMPGFDSVWVTELASSSAELSSAASSARNPLEAYLSLPRHQRTPNAIFDPAFYLRQVGSLKLAWVDPYWHYRRIGRALGLRPGTAFDSAHYIAENSDVADAGRDPLAHYLEHGAAEGRRANPLFDEDWYIRQPGCDCTVRRDALSHYLVKGWRAGLDPHPLFDGSWYLKYYPDVASSGANPWLHYLEWGWREHRRPNLLFDTAWYLATNPDVARAGIEPAGHFATHAVAEGRDPSPDFSTFRYLLAHGRDLPDDVNPLGHYLRQGAAEGREISPIRGDGNRLFTELNAFVEPPAKIDPYQSWLEVNPDSVESNLRLQERLSAAESADLPLISVIMPCYNSDPALLCEAIESVQAQLYENWELCICDDASPDPEVGRLLDRIAENEPRLKHRRAKTNLGIGEATNAAVALANGQVLAFLDHDDLLHPHALGELALAYASDAEVDIVYTDDDKIDMHGRRYSPQFKPDWSPVLLLSFMYMSHLFSMQRRLFDAVGGVRPAFDGSQDYDLALRVSEIARKVIHVPKILYHWRAVEGSTAVGGDAKPKAILHGQLAVQEAFDRRGHKARITQPPFAEASKIGVFEPVFPDDGPSVTVVIPTKNRLELLRVCVESLKNTTYRNFDILIIDNESDDPETLAYMRSCGAQIVQVKSPKEGFSFAHLLNAGVRAAKGEFVLLLNNDTKVRNPRWLSQMVGYARMPGVGAVGARLLYDDLTLQHGGITHGLHEGMAGHSFKLQPDWDPGYLQLALTSREVGGVTAACLLTPKALYEQTGGLDQDNFRVAYNDVDYCYRLVDAGYSCIQCASAELFHFEGKTRGFVDNPKEITAMRRKYRRRRDQFYNPNLSLENERFEVARFHLPERTGKPIRALFVSHNFNHEGAPNSLFELAVGLRDDRRVDPIVISPDAGPLLDRYEAAGIQAELVDNPLIGWLPNEEFQANLRRLAQSFLYSGVEVVIANTADSFWAIAAAELAGIPSIWIIRESQPWQNYFTHFPPHIAKVAYDCFTKPYRVVFVAQTTLDGWKPLDSKRNFTLNRNGLDTAKMIASFDGLDRAKLRAELGVADDDCLFICVGTICDRKGQIDLVRAFAKLPLDKARRAAVALIGDRPSDYSAQLHAEVAALPATIRDRIVVVGETSRARSFLVGSDVFVCSSRVESYPRVTLEAMAAGLPIITTGVWGITEQIRPNYNALIYSPGQCDVLAAHMVEMIENSELRETFASRAIPVFESLPDFDFMRDRYAELIEQAAGSC